MKPRPTGQQLSSEISSPFSKVCCVPIVVNNIVSINIIVFIVIISVVSFLEIFVQQKITIEINIKYLEN